MAEKKGDKKSKAITVTKIDKSAKDVKAAAKTVCQAVSKPGRIVSYDRLDAAVKALFDQQFAEGYENYIVKYPKPNGDSFYAVPFDTPKEHFLVKVDVKIDLAYDDDDKAFYDGDDVDDVEAEAGDVPVPTDVDDIADTLADDFNEPA